MNILKIKFDEQNEPFSLELEESVRKYVFDQIIRPNKEKSDELKWIVDLLLNYYSKQVRELTQKDG